MSEGIQPLLRGCFMSQGLYLKANGELPCWDDVGEHKILRKLDPLAASEGREVELSNFTALKHIRESFAQGRYPHPGLCERCAVRSAGVPHAETDPSILQVFHVEPSYMCHLSCPQCIPQKLRKSLKSPPYHLDPGMYEGVLRQLRAEGIRQIKLVVFEGRGDPLNCADLEKLVDLTKEYYPNASTSITTHGSFPYKDWIARSKLDVIRFSVDGARQENYAKYRIGGKLDMIFKFMESLRRDRLPGSRLYAEWKYILFEWNDSDEELAEAAVLALKFGVQLRFCRTHSPGQSKTYTSGLAVAEMIRRVAPRALQDLTFQLKDDADFADVDVVRGDQIRGLISLAGERAAAGEEVAASALILEVLALDGGMTGLPDTADSLDALELDVLGQVEKISLALTAEKLAAFFKRINRRAAAGPLLARYLMLSPDAIDRRHIEIEAGVESILEAHGRNDQEETDRQIRLLLTIGENASLLSLLGHALEIQHPGVAAAMANIFHERGHHQAAMIMFEQYLDLAPEALDHDQVSRHAAWLRSAHLMAMALRQSRTGRTRYAGELVAEAVTADGFASGRQAPTLTENILKAATAQLVDNLGRLAIETSDFQAAYHAEHRLRTDPSLG